MPISQKKEKGFSLLEALIAVSILSLMGTLTFETFRRSLDSREQAGKIASHYNQIRQAMLRMVHEIQMSFISEHRFCQDVRTDTLFVSQSSTYGMRLDFTSFSHVKMQSDANESDQNELSYFIKRDPNNSEKKVLIRREQIRIDEDGEKGGVEEILAENVDDLQFEFYNVQDDLWENTWDTKHSDYGGRLPKFVKITLTSKNRDEKEKFVTKTRIFIDKAIRVGGIKCTE